MKLAPSLHRLDSSLVNSYLVDEGGLVTIIDAGLPGYGLIFRRSSRRWADRSTMSARSS